MAISNATGNKERFSLRKLTNLQKILIGVVAVAGILGFFFFGSSVSKASKKQAVEELITDIFTEDTAHKACNSILVEHTFTDISDSYDDCVAAYDGLRAEYGDITVSLDDDADHVFDGNTVTIFFKTSGDKTFTKVTATFSSESHRETYYSNNKKKTRTTTYDFIVFDSIKFE